MATPSPEQFWTLLTESKLGDEVSLGKLRREFEGLPFPPGASAANATELVARWLVKRGVISEWQAKRLLRGEKGPFFLGDYRLLDRHDTGRGGTVFRARHEPTGRLVGITALNNKYCQQSHNKCNRSNRLLFKVVMAVEIIRHPFPSRLRHRADCLDCPTPLY